MRGWVEGWRAGSRGSCAFRQWHRWKVVCRRLSKRLSLVPIKIYFWRETKFAENQAQGRPQRNLPTGAIVASSEQLKALIKFHITRADGHFYSVAMQVAAHEAKLGHNKLAEELRDLIDAAKTRLSQDGSGKLVAIAGALNSAAKPRG